ncbi:hypothetical protein QRX60_47655 [Amycolatopsis mongoliensis]|uniref:Uncharacterized protein n=1 Tax=Amycolatopsis mongoliensis TaxID=715475 RepID=A0A9Y2JN83_9PSEU|nr:hypothetical protein [Amycolatopsis sp. 4-36]WIY01618.1 hypothetical protein QRX60_47655 [Amycolatopsis sp. 4-36]
MTNPGRTTARPDTSDTTTKTRSRFLALGLLLGVLWYVNGSRPLWEHALRMLVLMIVVLVALELLARRRYHGNERPHIRHGWIIGAKLALLAVAVGADWLLAQWTSRANLIVAIGLAVVVAVAGPRLAHRAVRGPGK